MYNRLFASILDSSIWLEDVGVRVVWVTLLASMNEIGFCKYGGILALSRRANLSLAETTRCVEVLESPDRYDPEQEFEGRRIEKVPGGWMVLNAGKYREMATRHIAMERTRLRVQKYRATKKGVTENAPVPEVPKRGRPSKIAPVLPFNAECHATPEAEQTDDEKAWTAEYRKKHGLD